MKIMTLNTHSWLEEEPQEKLKQIAQKICHEQYDVIALQEVNQTMNAKMSSLLAFFQQHYRLQDGRLDTCIN